MGGNKVSVTVKGNCQTRVCPATFMSNIPVAVPEPVTAKLFITDKML